MALNEFLTPIDVHLDQLLFDPNNLRFAELGDVPDIVPEGRAAEPKVQRDASEKMRNQRFEVAELRDTIRILGFLPMDRLVVRPWGNAEPGTHKFIVVEGNRRLAALKWLIELHDAGRETLNEAQLSNYTHLGVLLLDTERAPESAKWVLPGLRHVSGIKEWGPYQKARAVFVLRESGQSPQEVAQSLGLSTRAANQLWRSYLALEQMRTDEEYAEFAEPRQYSYFEEVFKRPSVRDWLGWSDAERRFSELGRIREFYSWMIGESGDDGERGEPKLPEAKNVRELGAIVADEGAMSVFRALGGNLTRALARFEVEHPAAWQGHIEAAVATLASLTPDKLRALSEQDVQLLVGLGDRLSMVMADRQRLLG